MSRRLRLSSALVAATIAVAGGASIATAAPTAMVPTATVTTETSAGGYTSLPPQRILDTRYGTGSTKAPIGSRKSITLQVTGEGGLPSSGVLAVVMNITVVRPTSPSGYLTVWPYGQSRPVVSSINWTERGWTGANLVTVPVGTGGKVSIYNSWGNTNVVADVMGYYRTSGAPGAYGNYLFVANKDTGLPEPKRIVDTRVASYRYPGPLLPYSWAPICVDFQDAAVNAHVTAVAVNITATREFANGWLSAWNGDDTKWPSTSTLNFTKGTTVANMSIVPTQIATADFDTNCAGLPAFGVYNGSAGNTDLVVDIVGVYDDNHLDGYEHYRFRKINPVRIVDSRKSLGFSTPGGNQTRTARVPSGYLNADTGGIVANLTGVRPDAGAVLTVWPNNGAARPLVSNLNLRKNTVLANMMITGLGAGADFNVFNLSAGRTDVLVDLAGAFDYYNLAPPAAAGTATKASVTPKAVGP